MQTVSDRQSGLLNAINRMAEKILGLCARVEAIPGKRPELLALLIYGAAHLVMAIFHEPWYDEAVAWQIARCASVRDILFEIPHYEGHPPLWHLILLPFAKLGAPYELSLTVVSLVFAGAAVGLIIWRSPFPRIVRLLLPFTYFFFYQYGVISRPYCVMMLAFMLLAMAYPGRNEKPGRYTLCLMLLCLTSAYGIVIAGGLAIVWVWEIWDRQNIGKFLKTFPKDKRIWWLAALLVLALLLIAEIMPRGDTFATNNLSEVEDKNGLLICLLYMYFASVADVMLTSAYTSYWALQMADIDALQLTLVCITGIVLWSIAIIWGRKKKTAILLVIPYTLFSVFAALVYVSPHHIGIGLLIIVFWLWVSCASSDNKFVISFTEQDLQIVKAGITVLCMIIMVVSLFWNAISCVKDVFIVYATGREEAAFISEHGLDQYCMMVGWDIYYDKEENIIGMDTNHCHSADNIAPYFENNLFFNYNDGDDRVNYSTHKRLDEAATEARLEKWATEIPEVLFMHPNLEVVYGDSCSMDEYALVYSQINSRIWKGKSVHSKAEIHVRRDIAKKLELVEVEEALPFWVRLFELLVQ